MQIILTHIIDFTCGSVEISILETSKDELQSDTCDCRKTSYEYFY